jgi:hypothetical protein
VINRFRLYIEKQVSLSILCHDTISCLIRPAIGFVERRECATLAERSTTPRPIARLFTPEIPCPMIKVYLQVLSSPTQYLIFHLLVLLRTFFLSSFHLSESFCTSNKPVLALFSSYIRYQRVQNTARMKSLRQ